MSQARVESAAEITALLNEHRFWLVQLGFSLAPAADHTINWARFLVTLEYRGQKNGPQVHGLLPLRAKPETARLASCCTVGADFRLYQAAAAPDRSIVSIPYESAMVEISGFGNGSSKPSWDCRGHNRVQGYLRMCMVVKKKKAETMQAEFTFNARVETPQGRIGAVLAPLLGGRIFCFEEAADRQ